MARRRAWWVSSCGLGVLAVVSCSKPKEEFLFDAATNGPTVSESKTTAAKIRQVYPIACDANAASWKWATCHDETKGFDTVLTCATAARDQAKADAARFPPAPTTPDPTCGGTVEAESRAFVTMTASYLDDMVTWLTAHKATLVGPLRASSIYQLLDDKPKAGMPKLTDEKWLSPRFDGSSSAIADA